MADTEEGGDGAPPPGDGGIVLPMLLARLEPEPTGCCDGILPALLARLEEVLEGQRRLEGLAHEHRRQLREALASCAFDASLSAREATSCGSGAKGSTMDGSPTQREADDSVASPQLGGAVPQRPRNSSKEAYHRSRSKEGPGPSAEWRSRSKEVPARLSKGLSSRRLVRAPTSPATSPVTSREERRASAAEAAAEAQRAANAELAGATGSGGSPRPHPPPAAAAPAPTAPMFSPPPPLPMDEPQRHSWAPSVFATLQTHSLEEQRHSWTTSCLASAQDRAEKLEKRVTITEDSIPATLMKGPVGPQAPANGERYSVHRVSTSSIRSQQDDQPWVRPKIAHQASKHSLCSNRSLHSLVESSLLSVHTGPGMIAEATVQDTLTEHTNPDLPQIPDRWNDVHQPAPRRRPSTHSRAEDLLRRPSHQSHVSKSQSEVSSQMHAHASIQSSAGRRAPGYHRDDVPKYIRVGTRSATKDWANRLASKEKKIDVEPSTTATAARQSDSSTAAQRHSSSHTHTSSLVHKRSSRRSRRSSVEKSFYLNAWETFVRCVNSPYFEATSGVLIICHAMLIAAYVEWIASYGPPAHPALAGCNTFLLILFVVEVALKVIALRMGYFCSEEWTWNLFDVTLVSIVFIEVIFSGVAQAESGHKEVKALLKIGEIARISRVLRIFRVLRFSAALRVILSKVFNSMQTLFWVMILICMLLFVVSILLTQGATIHLETSEAEDQQLVQFYFGSIFRSMYTLFKAVTGGLIWGSSADALLDYNGFYASLFLAFIAFTMFAILNIITGIFVDAAMQNALYERDLIMEQQSRIEESVAEHLREVFFEIDMEDTGIIVEEQFRDYLQDSRVTSFLRALNIDTSDAEQLFRLLDLDSSGEIYIDEFVEGAMKLRGQAKSMDLHIMICENRRMLSKIFDFMDYAEMKFKDILRHLRQEVAQQAAPNGNAQGTSRWREAGPTANQVRPDSPHAVPTAHPTPSLPVPAPPALKGKRQSPPALVHPFSVAAGESDSEVFHSPVPSVVA